MTITVEIAPEVQVELARQASVQGLAIEAVAATLLEEALHVPATPKMREPGKSLVKVCAMVKGLTDDVDFSRNPSTGRSLDLS